MQLYLSRNFYTSLEYQELKTRFKHRIGTNFKLGIIDNNEISIYYIKNPLTNMGLDRIPYCQVDVLNKKQEDGRLRIKFAIATFALITIGLIPVIFMLVFYFAVAPDAFYYPAVLYPLLYLFLIFSFAVQVDRFESDLIELETS